MKKKLLVSFSGGETSAYMAKWLLDNKQDEFEMIFVFANTGQENEQTLEFVEKCSKHFNISIVWLEAKVFPNERIGSSFIITDFKNAARSGEPFEAVISKYSIPNIIYPHCTRELKQNPIKAYAKSIGWIDYYLAIGIRADELSRINGNHEKLKIIYPLASKKWGVPTTKPEINKWWNAQPFRLELKGYQGNCKTCWKKSDNKLFQIAKETPEAFNFFDAMEQKYGDYIPESRISAINKPITFFRGNRSAKDILSQSKAYFKAPIDDARKYENNKPLDLFEDEKGIPTNIDLLDGESCDVWSECGSNN